MNEREIKVIDDSKITITDGNKQMECDILFTYEPEDNEKLFVGFTDNHINEKGELPIMFAKSSDYDDTVYETITDPQEIEMMSNVLKEIMNNYKEN